ncbi:DUF3352 domain-containing protein [Mariniblastus fucicola]|uniref:DUF3352 domain-containing protein n=1 Tax=Mariniblastus fucicola TaxID=980251 RepID=UPI00138FE62C|nr:DUF3352 domain-containing protein [Mariniblastus fucicola]
MKLRRIGRVSLLSRWAIASALVLFSAMTVRAQDEKAEPLEPTELTKEASVPEKETRRRSTAELLPTSTRFWVSVEDLRRLETNVANTQVGKLSRQDTLAPFFSSFEKQVRDSLNDNGIKFGIDVASVEMLQTGELCIAGVLPETAGAKPVPRSHGVVVLIDVSPDVDAAKDFLSDAAEKMKKRGAKHESIEIQDTDVAKWTIEVKAGKIGRTQASFVTVVDGWLLASDNESIFSNVLRRVNAKGKPPAADTLSGYEPFTTVIQKTQVESVRPDLRWFVDPLGYARFADALAEEKADMRQPKDRPLEALSKEGLDALKAAGGFVSFSTGEQDVLHRSLVYANPKKAKAPAQKRLFNLLDFAPQGSSVAQPPAWVPVDAAGYFTATWDIKKAFANVGPLVDAVMGKDSFEDVLNEMKEVPDFKVDIRKMVQSLGNRITVVATTEEPINESSEKMLVGIELVDGVDEEWLIQSIGRAVKGKVKKLAGYTSVIDDRTESAEDEDLGVKEIEIDFDDDFDDELDDDDDADDKEPAPRVTIFNRRIMVIRNGFLFICNDKDYLKKILSRKPSSGFETAGDFTRMGETLDKFTDSKLVRFRMFNRLDQMLKTNYEMMRTGKMAESETFVARMLNQMYGKKADGEKKRVQQIDGSDLPEDYDKEIAPFLGQSGWALETTESGWRITGCVLPKEKAKAKVAEAPDSSK